MAAFDFFRVTERRFTPRTPRAALRALESSLLPAEVYIYSATSVRPLDEEPYDVSDIERVLGREKLDIDSNLLLTRILRRLLRSPEQEVALFAAEGINLIEERYAKSIEALKEVEPPDSETMRELARLYSELSRLYPSGSSLRSFYLHEAYQCLTALRQATSFLTEDATRLLRVLIDLGLYDQAAAELDRYRIEHDKQFFLLEAEIEFCRHRYSRVMEICQRLREFGDSLDEKERSLLEPWVEGDGS